MAELKDLLGDAFKEGMTNDEIVDVISTSEKIVNLSKGNYVAKGKFEDLNSRYSKVMETTKDYEDFKKQAEEYQGYKKKVSYRETLRKAGIKDEAMDYAVFQIEKGIIADGDDLEKNATEWAKNHPIYAKELKKAEEKTKVPPENKTPAPKPEPKKKGKVIVDDLPETHKATSRKRWNDYNRTY